MIHVVLIEPQEPGNIGAIARAMKNFSVTSLILVNPQCDHLSKAATDRATHAKHILTNAKIKTFKEVLNYDYVIGTTAKLGTDYNIPRSPLTPQQLAKKTSKVQRNIALVFGREDRGLTNEEILTMDYIVTIPATTYSTLNLSHAVTIILYELFQARKEKKHNDHIHPIRKEEQRQILKIIDEKLATMHFATPTKKETQRKIWKRVVTKSNMTKREAYALIGFLKKL